MTHREGNNFYAPTGVLRSVNGYILPGDRWLDAVGGGQIRGILFICEDVPENAVFKFACDNPDLYKESGYLVRPIVGGNFLSKFAYFSV